MICDDIEGWDGRKEGRLRRRGYMYTDIKFWIFKHRVNIREDTVHESTWEKNQVDGKKSRTICYF